MQESEVFTVLKDDKEHIIPRTWLCVMRGSSALQTGGTPVGCCTGWPSEQLPQRHQTAQVLLPAVTGEWDDPSQQPEEDGEGK